MLSVWGLRIVGSVLILRQQTLYTYGTILLCETVIRNVKKKERYSLLFSFFSSIFWDLRICRKKCWKRTLFSRKKIPYSISQETGMKRWKQKEGKTEEIWSLPPSPKKREKIVEVDAAFSLPFSRVAILVQQHILPRKRTASTRKTEREWELNERNF